MNKRILIKLVFLIAVIGGLLFWFLWVRQTKNELFVTSDKSLSVENVKIELGLYSINSVFKFSNSHSDENLIKFGLDKLVYDGKSAKHFETIVGENDFFITFDNEYYTIIRHFNENDFYNGLPHPHKYNFELKRQDDKIHLKLKIEGDYGKIIEKDLVKITDANKNFWGRQINEK